MFETESKRNNWGWGVIFEGLGVQMTSRFTTGLDYEATYICAFLCIVRKHQKG